MNNDNNNNIMHVINFDTRDFRGSIDINHLVKVIALPKLCAAPSGSRYVVGLINYGGTVIQVIDLCMCLEISEPVKYSLNTPVIICQLKNKKLFGILVDKVHDIATVPDTMIQSIDDGRENHCAISGAIKYDGFLSLIIDVDSLLDSKNKKEMEVSHE